MVAQVCIMQQRTMAYVAALARAADVAPMTAMRFLAGLPVRGRIKARIERALSAAPAPARRERSKRAA
jgi:hypothetical protein